MPNPSKPNQLTVAVYDFTDHLKESLNIEYHVTTEPPNPESLKAHAQVADLGQFSTLKAARQAAHDHAGERGLHQVEYIADDTGGLVEAFELGKFGCLTQHGTRVEYAEAAFEKARESDPLTFADMAKQWRQEAFEQESARPDAEALIELLTEYHTGHQEGEHDDKD